MVDNSYKRDLYALSFSFFFVFLAFNSTQSLESSISEDAKLGTTTVSFIYIFFTLSSFVAPSIVVYLGLKKALVLGMSSYVLFIAANLYPSWETLLPAAVCVGFGASTLWTAQGSYLGYVANAYVRGAPQALAQTEGDVMGMEDQIEKARNGFTGVFFGIFQSTQVVGNLVAYYIFSLSGEDGSGSESEISSEQKAILFTTFSVSGVLGLLLLMFLVRSVPKEEEGEGERENRKVSVRSVLVEVRTGVEFACKDSYMRAMVVLFVYSGINQAFIWSDYTAFVVKPVLGEKYVPVVMAVFGA